MSVTKFSSLMWTTSVTREKPSLMTHKSDSCRVYASSMTHKGDGCRIYASPMTHKGDGCRVYTSPITHKGDCCRFYASLMTHKGDGCRVYASLMRKKGDSSWSYPSPMWRYQWHVFTNSRHQCWIKTTKKGYKIYLMYITNTHVLSTIYITSKQTSSINHFT